MTHRLNTAANLQTLFAGLVEQVFMARSGSATHV
jgi:hypothetical protein